MQPGVAGETGFVAPPEAAKEIDFSRHATANDIGLVAFLHGHNRHADRMRAGRIPQSAWLWNTMAAFSRPIRTGIFSTCIPIRSTGSNAGWLSDLDSEDDESGGRRKMERHIYEVEEQAAWQADGRNGRGNPDLLLLRPRRNAPWARFLNTAHAPQKRRTLPRTSPKVGKLLGYLRRDGRLQLCAGCEQVEGRAPALHVCLCQPSRANIPAALWKRKITRRCATKSSTPCLTIAIPILAKGRSFLPCAARTQRFSAWAARSRATWSMFSAGIHGRTRLRPADRRIRLRQPQEPAMFRGPNVKSDFVYPRPRWLADIVPTPVLHDGRPHPG